MDINKLQLTNTAHNTYNELVDLITILGFANPLFEEDEIFDKIGFVLDACVDKIISCLNLDDEAFFEINECLREGFTFDEMVEKVIGWKESE